MKISLRRRIVAFVEKTGRCTVDMVAAAVGRYITASQAKHEWDTLKRYSYKKRGVPKVQKNSDPVRTGTRHIVVTALIKLVNNKELLRLGKGVYGPLKRAAKRTA